MGRRKSVGVYLTEAVKRIADGRIWCQRVVVLYLGACALLSHAQQFGVGAPQPALAFQPGIMSTIAGTGISGYSGDGGPATSAEVSSNIKGIAADSSGDVFFVDGTYCTVRVVYEGGPTAAQLIAAENPAVTSPVVGNIYVVAGEENHCGTPADNSLATSVKLTTNTGGLGIDAAGDIYVSGTSSTVWVIYAGGTGTAGTNLISLEAGVSSPMLGYIYRVAGSGTTGNGGDGSLATSSTVELHGIDDIKLDAAGNMYIVDQGNNAIREVSASTGDIATIAGGGGTSSGASGNSPNGTPASSSLLNQPYAVAVDGAKNVYISDKNNNLIRIIYEAGNTAADLITLENPSIVTPVAGDLYNIAGGGGTTYSYGVLGTSAKLNGTTGIALDWAGNLYLAINGYNLVAELNAQTGDLSVIAGTTAAGTSTGTNGDGGIATNALLNSPRGLTVDSAGRIYITDSNDLRVRQVGPQGLIVFPGQEIKTTSAPKTTILTNVGNANLSFTGGSPGFSGTNASDFIVDTASSLNTCNFTSLAPGANCTLAVTYSPQGNGASTATLSFVTDGVLTPQQILLQGASLPATTTTLQVSTSSVTEGSAVTFTATVAGSASPGGNVSFYNNGSHLLGTSALNSSGVAAFSYTPTTTGLLSVTAVYSGDTANAGSSSSTILVNVTGSAASTTKLAASSNAIGQGQNVTFTATVTGGGATPTGTVTFSAGTSVLGRGNLNGSGQAVLSSTALPAGPDNVEASYSGDATYMASTSTVAVQVTGTPTISLTASPATVNAGVSETLTATITWNGVAPTGTVTFYAGATTLGAVPLAGGVATFSTATLADGTYSMTAIYSGDSNYATVTSSAVNVTVYGRVFVHPGGLHTQADLDRMKTQVAAGAHPWIDDWNLLVQDPWAQSNYTPHPLANMGSNRQLADQDAHAAYLNAIRWYISGDTAYANTAMNILNAWAATVNQVPTGNNTPGLVAIPIQDFALAGEVLRIYPGWSAADFATFQNMFTNYLYPVVNDFLTNHNGACISHYWANWDAANLSALIAMGVLDDNTNWFNQGVAYYENGAGNGSIQNAIYHVWPGNSGQWQEAGRDQEHDQLGVGLLGYAAQTAWNQGVDLFGYSSNRLLAGAEYTAQYNTDQLVPYTTYNNCDNVQQFYISTDGRGRLDDRPVWELLYNHYNVLNGVSTPNTQAMAELMRPEHGSNDHFGYGTLTFTLEATASSYPPAPTPAAPKGVEAAAGIGLVYLNWAPTATANGYNVLRSTSGGGYVNIASLTQTTLPQYTDTSVTNGTAYSYEIEAINQSGTSAASTPSTATPMAAGALPTSWADQDIGSVSTAGSAQYATTGNGTYLVSGQGAGIGGPTDSFNYAYTQVTGDFTLVARLASVAGANLNHTGLMMRESLNANATAVIMVLGSTGGRIAQMGSRSSAGVAMTWSTGNQYTVTPVWLKLQRSGNVFTAFQSSDSVTWFTVGTSTVSMASTYYVGFAACSGDTATDTTETSTFDNAGPAAPANGTLDFTMTVDGSSTTTVVPGSAATYRLAVAPTSGNYAGTVTFQISGLPAGATAVFSPASIAANGGSQTVTVTIQTASTMAYDRIPARPTKPTNAHRLRPIVLGFLTLLGIGGLRKRRSMVHRLVCALALVAAGAVVALPLGGCGASNGSVAQQQQNYALTISGTSGNLQHTVTVTLDVQ